MLLVVLQHYQVQQHRDGTRTWSSGSTQPLDSGNQNVTSFSIVSPVSGFSISGAVVTANSNSSTSTRSVRVRGTYSGVNSPEATITQSAATERTYYEYSISLNPTSASFSATGESKSFTVTSQRRLVTVNSVSGTTYGSWGSTGWEIYPTNLGTGFSQTTSGNTITVKASANSGSSRSGTLSVRCTGDTSETASANLSQSGATTTTTTEYEFSVSPTSLSFTKDGGNQTVSIVSRSRPKYTNDINGEVSYGNWSAVSYTAFSSTTPTGTGTNSASVSVGVNTGAARSATITYTQSGSGTKKTVSCSQAVGTQTRTVRDYSFSANPTSLSFDASGGTKSVTVTSQYRDGTQSSTDEGNNWSSTSWGNWQTASYTGTVDNTGGGAFSGSGNSVTAGANSSTSSRSGNLRLSQTRSGIQENGNSWPSPSNINVRLSQSGNYTSWTLGLGDINITHFDSIRGGITGRVETVTSSATDYVINELTDLIYEFNSLNNTSEFPIQLVRIFDKRLFEVSFSTSWENENYNLYINENISFISIMWRTNSTVRNAKLIITPQDRNRAPVTITFTAYQK